MARHGRRENIHETPDVSHISNPDVAHEESDVNVWALIYFVGGLLLFAIIVHVLMWLMFDFMEDRAESLEPPPAPMALTQQERLPPEPRLQVAPGWEAEGQDLRLREPQAEMKIVSERWQRVLSEGEKDASGNYVILPIDEATRRLIEQGLPSRPQEGGQNFVTGGIDVPSYQSSGRQVEKRDQ
ncbi:MAG TPA: hypothetical protein VD966_13435 [Pyrinomonadaceae bacterium]|nr:hypothetical protein [Pyrinomonadaceae bacterium]